MQNNSSLHLLILQIETRLDSRDQTGHTHTHQKMFNQFLISINLYQLVKNQLIPSVYSWDS